MEKLDPCYTQVLAQLQDLTRQQGTILFIVDPNFTWVDMQRDLHWD